MFGNMFHKGIYGIVINTPMKYKSVIYYNKNGKLHRLDGPAVIHPDGYKSWHVNSDHYGEGKEAPEKYLYELEILGVKFVRGSDDVE